jgi:hypothetical protein
MSDIITNTKINIETITTSDNIKQFMDKCNNNFAAIAEKGGGPRGVKGQNGETGATGKRGNKFHYVPINTDVPFGPEEATAALSNVDDIEYGDFVFFFVQGEEECAYAAFVDFEETSEGFVPVITSETLISLQGPKGEQGVPGDAASDQFEADGDGLTLRDSYHRIVLPKPTQALSSTPSSTLCIVKGGIGFVSGDREKSAINGSNDNGEFTISSELNMSLVTSKEKDITIGKYGNTVSKNINIIGGDNINIIQNGSANRISLDQNNVIIYGKSKFDNDIDVTGKISSTGIISSTQKITSPSIETNNLKITGLNTLGFVQINSNDGFNVGNVFKINPTNKKINITSNVDSTQPIRAKVGNDVMELGVPKYTFMLYPKSATTPSGWCEFSNDLIIPIISEENYGTQSSYQSGNQLWFKYKVSTTTDGITTSTMKYVKINLSEIYQVTFDRTRMSSVTTISSNTSGSESAESYTFEPISKNGVNYVSENPQSQSSSSMSPSYNVPNFIDNDMSVVDYDIVVDDIGELPWEQVVIPNNILNNYQQLIKHMLTNKGSLQNMSGIFTRMNIIVPIGQNYNRNTFYTLSVPDKASMFKWIFKVS